MFFSYFDLKKFYLNSISKDKQNYLWSNEASKYKFVASCPYGTVFQARGIFEKLYTNFTQVWACKNMKCHVVSFSNDGECTIKLLFVFPYY